jgi:hypothetical protein
MKDTTQIIFKNEKEITDYIEQQKEAIFNICVQCNRLSPTNPKYYDRNRADQLKKLDEQLEDHRYKLHEVINFYISHLETNKRLDEAKTTKEWFLESTKNTNKYRIEIKTDIATIHTVNIRKNVFKGNEIIKYAIEAKEYFEKAKSVYENEPHYSEPILKKVINTFLIDLYKSHNFKKYDSRNFKKEIEKLQKELNQLNTSSDGKEAGFLAQITLAKNHCKDKQFDEAHKQLDKALPFIESKKLDFTIINNFKTQFYFDQFSSEGHKKEILSKLVNSFNFYYNLLTKLNPKEIEELNDTFPSSFRWELDTLSSLIEYCSNNAKKLTLLSEQITYSEQATELVKLKENSISFWESKVDLSDSIQASFLKEKEKVEKLKLDIDKAIQEQEERTKRAKEIEVKEEEYNRIMGELFDDKEIKELTESCLNEVNALFPSLAELLKEEAVKKKGKQSRKNNAGESKTEELLIEDESEQEASNASEDMNDSLTIDLNEIECVLHEEKDFVRVIDKLELLLKAHDLSPDVQSVIAKARKCFIGNHITEASKHFRSNIEYSILQFNMALQSVSNAVDFIEEKYLDFSKPTSDKPIRELMVTERISSMLKIHAEFLNNELKNAHIRKDEIVNKIKEAREVIKKKIGDEKWNKIKDPSEFKKAVDNGKMHPNFYLLRTFKEQLVTIDELIVKSNGTIHKAEMVHVRIKEMADGKELFPELTPNSVESRSLNITWVEKSMKTNDKVGFTLTK